MRRTTTIGCVALLAALMTMSCLRQAPQSPGDKAYDSPTLFEETIRRFESADGLEQPPPGAIVCIGSSSMGGWHATIEEDLAPLTVIPRGFGGSNMNDALYFADRIVTPYRPRAVVLYEGDNDVAQGIPPEKIADTFRAFVKLVHDELPATRVYFLSIKPSISRWRLWPQMQKANSLIADQCNGDNRLTYVDVATGMLDDEGQPRQDIFQKDGLHMTRDGYVIWRDALRPILLNAELRFESQKGSAGK